MNKYITIGVMSLGMSGYLYRRNSLREAYETKVLNDPIITIENATYRPHTEDDDIRITFGPNQINFNTFKCVNDTYTFQNIGYYPKIKVNSNTGTFYLSSDKNYIADSKIVLYRMQLKDYDNSKKWF
jgi:hypothetical protein